MKRDFVRERRQKIVDFVNERNRAKIGELAELFRTTDATIRRDLASLENEGRVYRVHGGVLRRDQPSVWQTTSLHDRLGMRTNQKSRIATFATSLVEDGDSIMIDSGSTTMLVAQQLRVKKNLLVVSNAPTIAPIIGEDNDSKIILTGGELLKETAALIGMEAEHTLNQYRTDKAIIGLSGLLLDEGCFSAIPQEASIKRLMSKNSRETIIVADSSKIGTRAFCFIFDLSYVNKLVIDDNISPSAVNILRQQGVEVFLV